MPPDVSLAIPVYDSASFLDELFACLRALDPMPAEIVFLDDASTDNSLALLERFAATADTGAAVRVLHNAQNGGIAAAYNRLVRETRGEWLQLLDADDLIADRDFYRRIQLALRYDIDVVVTGLRSNARLLDGCSRLFGWLVPRSAPTCWPLLGSFATRAGVIYRRSRLIETPFPDPAWPGSDVIHLLEIRRTSGCVFLRSPRVFYRVHASAQSSRSRDYGNYRHQLDRFGRATRWAHRIDLRLRQLGQRWAR